MQDDYVLSVENLKTGFRVDRHLVVPVRGVSFQVRKGKTLGLVGESGCGKSVTAHSIMKLLAKNGDVLEGSVQYRTKQNEVVELAHLKRYSKTMNQYRGSEIAMVFQDPMASLNPVHPIGEQIIEGLLYHEKITKKEALERAEQMLTMLGIPKAKERMKDYPHQFSGGMKQRVMIAIGMIGNPNLLIADEPTTALDVTIQAQILELMKDMQRQFGTSVILITHNMGIVADMADDMAVMYMGKIVEFGTGDQVFANPCHPYTKALLNSVPVLGIGRQKRLEPIRGSTPDLNRLGEGCEFAPRCDFATEQCFAHAPGDTSVEEGHRVRCWHCEGGATE